MKVRVRYFASLREVMKRSEETREIAPGATPRSLLAEIVGPAGAARVVGVAFAVNLEYAHGDEPLKDGDQVAFLPPVSGG